MSLLRSCRGAIKLTFAIHSLCVLTGRFGAVLGLNFIGGFRPDPSTLDSNDPNYNFLALEALHRIYVSCRAGCSLLLGRSLTLSFAGQGAHARRWTSRGINIIRG